MTVATKLTTPNNNIPSSDKANSYIEDMTSANPLNVYAGPDAVQQYFDPDVHPLLPLIEVPACLNPFYADGVRIYAKMMGMHPANNVKIMPGKEIPLHVVAS